ncbi:hypothetical protein OG711_23660 [Streptomyces uncialis]|uniref:hypothetical protein n=1 Tax=Streptomyces uncialis TaxID=1048205 RepID=UPI0022584FA0|nr:hypothetical protein [Streptomyces uncialis]MCX4664379.1 hypothetical protein [Streptomyces uncialis]
MVTSSHEAAHRIFQERPELLSPVFRVLGVPLPDKAAVEVLTGDATEIRPLERRVDSVLRVESSDGTTFLLAIEAQGRRDPDKAASWTYYLAFLRAKYDLPALLLVVCRDRATAKWATGPFLTGIEGWTALSTHPLVIGPDNIPVITSPAEASKNLALATFAAMTHGKDRDITPILDALATALGTVEVDTADYFTELLELGLGDTQARNTWRNMMSVGTYFPGRGTIVEESYLKGKTEGREEGRAATLIDVLEMRGISVSEETRERITSTTDSETLTEWLAKALTATAEDDLFTKEQPPAEAPGGHEQSPRRSP